MYYISLNNDSMMTATSSHTSRHKKEDVNWMMNITFCMRNDEDHNLQPLYHFFANSENVL